MMCLYGCDSPRCTLLNQGARSRGVRLQRRGEPWSQNKTSAETPRPISPRQKLHSTACERFRSRSFYCSVRIWMRTFETLELLFLIFYSIAECSINIIYLSTAHYTLHWVCVRYVTSSNLLWGNVGFQLSYFYWFITFSYFKKKFLSHHRCLSSMWLERKKL